MRIGIFCKSAHHRIEPGAIPAAGQHPDLHRFFLQNIKYVCTFSATANFPRRKQKIISFLYFSTFFFFCLPPFLIFSEKYSRFFPNAREYFSGFFSIFSEIYFPSPSTLTFFCFFFFCNPEFPPRLNRFSSPRFPGFSDKKRQAGSPLANHARDICYYTPEL